MTDVKILISGGGTGGHIFPAIAIANAVKDQTPQAEILFVGAQDKMEMEKVPAAGYPIKGLWISGLHRSLSLKNLLFPLKLIVSLIKSFSIIRSFKPDAVVGVGGFASGPVLYVATRMKIPVLVQEQNSFPGITNKLVADKANRICVAYEGMEKHFPKNRILLTGNPVRKEMVEITGKRAEAMDFFGLNDQKKTLLVIGGSLGARSINTAMEEAIGSMLEKGLQVIWQTGKSFAEKTSGLKARYRGKDLFITEFIQRMDLAYAAANIVVSRAGAIAVSELCLVGKPCILVPFPFAAEDHQTKNAQALVNKHAAIHLPDKEVKERLLQEVTGLMENETLQRQLSENIVTMAKPEAAKTIAAEVIKLAKA